MPSHVVLCFLVYILKHMDFTFGNLHVNAPLQLVSGQILTCFLLVLFCFQKKSKYVSIARGGYQGMTLLLLSKLGHG